MANTQNLSVAQLKRALELAENIQKLESELAGILGNGSQSTPAAAPAAAPSRGPGRKPKAVEAEVKAEPAKRGPKPGKAAKVGKRVVSEEARAKMAEAARKRWALRKGL